MYEYEYPRPAVTVDMVVFHNNLQPTSYYGLNVLLIKRGKPPFKGRWALPGGFLNMNETCEQAAIRETKEETNADVDLNCQVGVFDSLDRDPRGRTISVAFFGYLDSPFEEIEAGDDAAEVEWFSVDDLPKMAFDHKNIIIAALEL